MDVIHALKLLKMTGAVELIGVKVVNPINIVCSMIFHSFHNVVMYGSMVAMIANRIILTITQHFGNMRLTIQVYGFVVRLKLLEENVRLTIFRQNNAYKEIAIVI